MGNSICNKEEKEEKSQHLERQQSYQLENTSDIMLETQTDFANNASISQDFSFKKDQAKQQNQIHYNKIMDYLQKNQEEFDFFFQEFVNYIEFGDLSKRVDMQKEKWMNLTINQAIKSKHVSCNMKVDLLKDFFQLKKEKRVKKRRRSNKKANSDNKEGNNSILKQEKQITEEEQKKTQQQQEIRKFLETEAVFYDHIFSDLSRLFYELFQQKYHEEQQRDQLGENNDSTLKISQKKCCTLSFNKQNNNSYVKYNNNNYNNNNNLSQISTNSSFNAGTTYKTNINTSKGKFVGSSIEYTEDYGKLVSVLLDVSNIQGKKRKSMEKKVGPKWEEMCKDISIFIGFIEEFLKISYTTYRHTQIKQIQKLSTEDKSIQDVFFANEDLCTLADQFFEYNGYLNTQVLKSFCLRHPQILNQTLHSICESSTEITEKLSFVYAELSHITPQALGIKSEFCLTELSNPYKSSIQLLEKMNETPNPVKILQSIINLQQDICNNIYQYKKQRNSDKNQKFFKQVDGDQLIMLFCYILIKAAVPELYNIFEIVNYLTDKQQSEGGEEAFCFNMILSAQNYLVNLASQKENMEKIIQNCKIQNNYSNIMNSSEIQHLYCGDNDESIDMGSQ